MAEPDLLFAVRNHFFLGAYQAAIAEAADLEGLSETEKVERDCYVYRSYIELGSYEVMALDRDDQLKFQQHIKLPKCAHFVAECAIKRCGCAVGHQRGLRTLSSGTASCENPGTIHGKQDSQGAPNA